MYTAYWKLHDLPFRNAFRPAYYFPSGSHQAALLKIRYAVEQHQPSALLVGPAGTGKSFTIHLLSQSLEETFQPVVCKVGLFDDPEAFLVDLAEELGHPAKENLTGYRAFRYLEETFNQNRQRGHHGILVLDNAHVFQHHRTWDVLRNLITLSAEGRPPWTVILVAHPLLLSILERLPYVEELFATKSFLRSLTPEETADYIAHCLKQAGTMEPVFTAEAVARIAEFSGGIPRRINRLCDLSLLVAYAEKSAQVDASHVEAVFEELSGIPAQ